MKQFILVTTLLASTTLNSADAAGLINLSDLAIAPLILGIFAITQREMRHTIMRLSPPLQMALLVAGPEMG
jgi:hypothetical protein